MPTAGEWMDVAREAMDAARILFERGLWRSSVNRAYYAAHAAAHAMAVHFGVSQPQTRNNWSHKELPGALWDALRKSKESKENSQHFIQQLAACAHNRVTADYRAGLSCSESMAKLSTDGAKRLCYKAERVLR